MSKCRYSQEIAKKIEAEFEIRVEDKVEKFLGIVVHRDEPSGSITIHNAPMVDEILSTFNMTDCRKVSTPLPSGTVLTATMDPGIQEDRQEMEGKPYRQLIGAMLHLANTVRPDIAFAVGYLARFMENPTLRHWNAAKHILKYLKSTRDLGITYEKNILAQLVGYSDADFAGDRDSRTSTSGYVFKYAGGAISWRSKRQTVTAQSTMEAEYVALSYAPRELVWLRRLLGELKFQDVSSQLVLYSDNEGAISFSRNQTLNDRTKHIQVKYHFIREHVENNTISLQHISTLQMTADVMTKNLSSIKHLACTRGLGMVSEKEKCDADEGEC